MDLLGLIRLIKDMVPSKQERFNRSLVELYKALKYCHLAYEQLQLNPKSERKASAHKNSIEELSALFSEFYDYFDINNDNEIINNVEMYIALESFNNAKYYKDYKKMDQSIKKILVSSSCGDFETASKMLKAYLKDNVSDKYDLFDILRE
ncbi:hypothetical protein [Aeromonas media]|uniref:hypothetical protein n=1 Tax=Aeromonas media TaxID=651 RepID=UPI003D1EC42A